MIFVRRSGAPERYLTTRITLGFFGAGIWVAGVVSGNRAVTGAAMFVVLLAVGLGWVARYQENRAARLSAEAGDDEGEEAPDEGGTSVRGSNPV